MADFAGPLRPSDSWSSTEVRSLSHSHVWTIRGFSNCDVRYLETNVKVRDQKDSSSLVPSTSSIESSPITFRIRLHPQGNKESNKDFSFFQVFCSTNTNTTKYRAKFAVYNCRNEEIPTTVYTGTQQLHGYFEYIRRDLLVQHVLPQDELQLVLNLTVTFDTVTKCSQNMKINTQIEPKYQEISKDLDSILSTGKLADFIIELNEGKEIKVHKMMLAARSPVFSAMLEPHTEESQTGRVLIKDVDSEVMNELLHYIYTGKSPNLSSLALDLLAVADRYQLPGLKEMADMHLRSSLAIETASRNLVYADMHNAHDLRREAIQFIANNMQSVVQTDGWHQLVEQQGASLVNEVIGALVTDKSYVGGGTTSSSSISDAPTTAKRPRMDLSV